MTDWRGGSTASSGMSGTNRTSAIKAAFQSQFKSSFVCISINKKFILFFLFLLHRLQQQTLVLKVIQSLYLVQCHKNEQDKQLKKIQHPQQNEVDLVTNLCIFSSK